MCANCDGSGASSKWGEFSWIDSVIEMGGGENCKVVQSNRSIYMRNVYVKGCATLVAADGPSSKTQTPIMLPSSPGWTVVNEMVAGRPIPNGGMRLHSR